MRMLLSIIICKAEQAAIAAHGVETVAVAACKVVAPPSVVFLEMADRGSTPHLAVDGSGDPTDFGVGPDVDRSG